MSFPGTQTQKHLPKPKWSSSSSLYPVFSLIIFYHWSRLNISILCFVMLQNTLISFKNKFFDETMGLWDITVISSGCSQFLQILQFSHVLPLKTSIQQTHWLMGSDPVSDTNSKWKRTLTAEKEQWIYTSHPAWHTEIFHILITSQNENNYHMVLFFQ